MKNSTLKFVLTSFLLLLLFVVSNVITGAIVYQMKDKEYTSLKNSIQTTITQKLKVQDELEAYKLACPDVTIEE